MFTINHPVNTKRQRKRYNLKAYIECLKAMANKGDVPHEYWLSPKEYLSKWKYTEFPKGSEERVDLKWQKYYPWSLKNTYGRVRRDFLQWRDDNQFADLRSNNPFENVNKEIVPKKHLGTKFVHSFESPNMGVTFDALNKFVEMIDRNLNKLTNNGEYIFFVYVQYSRNGASSQWRTFPFAIDKPLGDTLTMFKSTSAGDLAISGFAGSDIPFEGDPSEYVIESISVIKLRSFTRKAARSKFVKDALEYYQLHRYAGKLFPMMNKEDKKYIHQHLYLINWGKTYHAMDEWHQSEFVGEEPKVEWNRLKILKSIRYRKALVFQLKTMSNRDHNIENIRKQIVAHKHWERRVARVEREAEVRPKFISILKKNALMRFNVHHGNHYRRIEGEFSVWKSTINLPEMKRYQIYTGLQIKHGVLWINGKKKGPKINDEQCFVHTLRMSKLFTDDEISSIKLFVRGSAIKISKLKPIAELLNAHFIIHYRDLSKDTWRRSDVWPLSNKTINEETRVVKIAVFDSHYFLDEPTRYTTYSIRHYDELVGKKNYVNWYDYYREGRHDSKKSKLSSRKLVALMQKQELLVPIEDLNYLTKNRKKRPKNLTKYESLSYSPLMSTKLVKNRKSKAPIDLKKVYFADFESDVNGEYHVPYAVSYVRSDWKIPKHKTRATCTKDDPFKWLNDFLDDLPSKSVTYFHNLGYDFKMLLNFVNPVSIIKKQSLILTVTCTYKKKIFYFKDSYSMITSPLSGFSKMFDLEEDKAPYPYELYHACLEGKIKSTVPVQDALDLIAPAKHDIFLKTIHPKFVDKKSGEFRLWYYCYYYCNLDVTILRDGYLKFRTWFLEELNLDTLNFLTIPSLADYYCIREGAFEGVFSLTGVPRQFLSECVAGGRVQTRDNEKIMVSGLEVVDFDGVSLYPSAMALMGYLKGTPNVLDPHTTMKHLNKMDGYFVRIKITDIGTNLHFPLIKYKDENGTLQYENKVGVEMYVDKVGLEDLIKFQRIKFEVIQGYGFSEGRNYKIQKIIKHLFDMRLKKKQEGNPAQIIYKLLMNSAYGKTILKPILHDLKFINNSDYKYMTEHYREIKEITQISNDRSVVILNRDISIHYSRPQVGVEILSMSKRIMNQVFNVAEVQGYPIFYQDTDSMHMLRQHVPLLAKHFRAKYKRDLIGKQLGQFHTDFDLKGSEGEIYSTLSIFLGKKCYIDRLKCTGNDVTGHHVRMKGTSRAAIDVHSSNPIKTFKRLMKNECLEMDLLAGGRVSFVNNKNLTISTKKKFIRNVKFVTPYYMLFNSKYPSYPKKVKIKSRTPKSDTKSKSNKSQVLGQRQKEQENITMVEC